MPLLISCPSCRAKLKAPEKLIGKTVKCPKCESAIPVRAAAAPAPAPAPKKPSNDFDFVDEPDERPAPKKGGPIKKARDEYMDDDPPPRKAKTKPSRRDELDDDEDFAEPPPRDDYDDEDRPRKKKGRSGGGPSGSTNEQDRQNAFLVYLIGIIGGFVGIGPLGGIVWWLMKRGESRFVDHHGKEFLNLVLSSFLFVMVALLLIGICVGIAIAANTPALIFIGILLGVLFSFIIGITLFVLEIIAMFKAKAGEWYRIPMIFHFFKV